MGVTKHPNLNIPVRAALLLIVVRLAFHFADINWPEFQMIFVFLAVGALIPLCIYAIWPRENKQLEFLKEIAGALRVMAVYAVIMIVFIVVYYAFIDTSYFPEKRADILRVAIESDPQADQVSLAEKAKEFFSLRNFSILLLVGFLISSGFYALFFTILKRLLMKQK